MFVWSGFSSRFSCFPIASPSVSRACSVCDLEFESPQAESGARSTLRPTTVSFSAGYWPDAPIRAVGHRESKIAHQLVPRSQPWACPACWMCSPAGKDRPPSPPRRRGAISRSRADPPSRIKVPDAATPIDSRPLCQKLLAFCRYASLPSVTLEESRVPGMSMIHHRDEGKSFLVVSSSLSTDSGGTLRPPSDRPAFGRAMSGTEVETHVR